MSAGCQGEGMDFDGMSSGFQRTLWAIIVINAVMFVVEMTAGAAAGSQALKADALDFLGDTTTYGISLYVIGKPLTWRARAAALKGLSLAAMGLWIIGSTLYQVLAREVPEAGVMGLVGILAFAANLLCVLLLLRYRQGDANIRSVWLCSRNDAVGNLAVVGAALGVQGTTTAWPDLIVAVGMAGLFVWSSVLILRQARHETLQAARATRAAQAAPAG